jgi:hypothetical protein
MSSSGPSVWTDRALQAKSDDLEVVVLRFCIRPLNGTLCSWPSWISARARSHSRLGPEGHMGHLITNALARPFSISSFRLADLGGKANWLLGSARAVPSEPPSLARPIWRATEATGGGGHPLGEPERVHFRLLPLSRAPDSCALAPARSRRSVPACWRGPQLRR